MSPARLPREKPTEKRHSRKLDCTCKPPKAVQESFLEPALDSLLTTAMQHISEAVEITDAQARIQYVNAAFEAMTGYTRAESVGRTSAELLCSTHEEAFYQTIWQTVSSGEVWQGYLTEARKDGSRLDQEVTVAPVYDSTNQITHYITIRRAISQQQDETPLLDHDNLWMFAEAMPLPLAISRLADGTVLYANSQVEATFGLSSAELLERKSLDFYANPEDRAVLLEQLAENSCLQNYEVQVKKADGTLFWVAVSTQTLVFNDEPATLTVFCDITERKQIEARSHLMERAIIASSNGIVITDANQIDNPIIYVNPAFEIMTGYTAAEVIGYNCRFLQATDTDQPALEQLRAAIQMQQECRVTLRNYRKDGTLLWNELHTAPVFDAAGHLTHFVGIQTDISNHVQAETTLRQQEEQYRRIVETATEGIWLLDRDNNTSFVNQQIATMLGYTLREMLGKPLFEFMNETEIASANLHLERRRRGIHEAHDFKFCRKDGTDLWAIVSTAPLLDAEGNYAGALGMLTDITERKQAEAALLESQQRIDSILHSVEDVVWSVSAVTFEVLYLNPAAERLYGRPISDFFKNSNLWFEVVHPDDQEQVRSNSQTLLATGSKAIEYRIVRPDGEIRWLYDRGWLTYDGNGKAIRLDGISTDITERRQAEEALRKSEERFRLIFELAPIGMAVTTADGQYLAVNQAMCETLGYTSNELLRLSFADITHPDDLATGLAFNRKLLSKELSHFQIEKRYLAKDGRSIWTILQATLVRNEAGDPLHIIAQMVDITARKQMEEHLVYDAFHDALTQLPNRSLFLDRLQQAIFRSKRGLEEQFAVLFLDLDRFKVVNDSLGHLVGDQLLVAIAQRLQACLRSSDTIARLGGDEFAILANPIETVHDATAIAKNIHQMLQFPFNLDGHEIFANTSIGIALSTTGYHHPNDILRDADTAMYYAKELGKACYAVFDTAMYNQAVRLLRTETDLRWAIERQELRIYYQPIVSLITGRLDGFEALVRWHHPERGLISPAEFIPIAEETGLIVSLGDWVLQAACRQLDDWQTRFPDHAKLTISVNLSAKQFSQPNLVEQVAQVLQKTGLNPHSLKLEITESGIMRNARSAAILLEQLKALQVQLCIDDFGTGYSSLSRLHQFPIDTLKIDRSFVHTMNDPRENTEIVQAIIALSHNLGMTVVAEGVETLEQLIRLRELNCEYGQGYFFAKPLNAKAAEALLGTEIQN